MARRAVLSWFRAVWAVGVLTAVALGTAGCAGGADGPMRGAEGRSKPGGERLLRVAAAADLKFAMEDLIAAFHQERPNIRVEATYGSSGNFASQIENGAPFDIFFSADVAYPRRLTARGLAAPGSEFLYAVGRIVLWVPADSPLAAEVEREGVALLKRPEVRHLAIANPKHAPYGRAAEAALRRLGVYEAVKERLVFGENVAQTAEFARSGAADAAVIALSLALAPTMRAAGRYWEFPLDSYPRMEQGGVILARVADREAAAAFRAFVTGERGRAILKEYGFYLPEEPAEVAPAGAGAR